MFSGNSPSMILLELDYLFDKVGKCEDDSEIFAWYHEIFNQVAKNAGKFEYNDEW